MIPEKVITDYLNREVENHDNLKQLTNAELDTVIAGINPRPDIRVPFNQAQKVAFILGVLYPAFVLHLDMGVGKTAVTLELLRWYHAAGLICHTLILAPTDEIIIGWEDEIRRWEIGLPYLMLHGSSRQKWDMLLDASLAHGLVLTSYMGWCRMVSQKVTGEKRNRFDTDRELLKLLSEYFDSLVLDEMTRGPAYRDNLTFKAIRPISQAAKVRFGLAGRLFGKDPMPVWGQFYLIDHGASFGPTMGLFREVFFKSKKRYWGGYDYEFDKAREADLYRFLGNRSIYFAIDEVTDLPEMTVRIKTCVLADDTMAYYRSAVERFRRQKGDVNKMRESFLRMRQISSGFVGIALDDEDEDEGKAVIEFPNNPKLDLLMELIEELPEERKAIVFHEFNWSGARICHALTEAKIKHGWLRGGTKDWKQIKQRFDGDPRFRVLVVNWRKGGYGLNLQAASYGFFYESPMSIIDREQSERRLRREGQRWPVFITDLVTRGSVDETILHYHQAGRDLWEEVMRNPDILS